MRRGAVQKVVGCAEGRYCSEDSSCSEAVALL